jgi:Family of unknown function (DUF5906)
MIAKPGLFDFDRLNKLCSTQIASDVTAEQLAGFIEGGQVTVADLIVCGTPQGSDEADPYTRKLKKLAQEQAAGKLLKRQVDDELKIIAKEFDVRWKSIEPDFKRFEKETSSPILRSHYGILSAEDAALIKPMRNYVRDFAILNTGGKAVIMNLKQPDLSKAIMAESDFELLYRNEWVEVTGEDGRLNTIYPAKQFLSKPPKDTRVYRGGFVFKPSGTVAADEYNLYRGMLIEPDPSGSCSMLHELIKDVWAQGDQTIAEWVLEWLMHIIAHPGQKVGTSIAIRGGYGDGKSIVFKLMSTILGDMLLRVTNHRMILGDFNEAMLGKLLTVFEEAAFAGDKAAFDKMKELITGEKVLINPKFKAPITVDNYSRLFVISNQEHFLHIKPDDRRYTALESSPVWKRTSKFEQLVEEWENGGAARFVHDALNHSFRQLDGCKSLAISSNITTQYAVRQMAQSRSALEKCIVALLLEGGLDGSADWSLEEPLEIGAKELQRQVEHWMQAHDSTAARHETALHQIIGTVKRYVGKPGKSRPKGRREPGAVCRPQLPTIRHLPPRREAVHHAWEKGLLTDEEYAVIPPPPQHTLERFMVEEPLEGGPIEADAIDWNPVPKSTHRARAVFHPNGAPSPHTHVATSTVH